MQEYKDKRNVFPVERQIETTGQTVCTFSSFLHAEQRNHRRVGYKNSVSRFHMLALSKTYNVFIDVDSGNHIVKVGKSFPIYDPKFRIVTSTPYDERIPQTSYVLDVLYPKLVFYMIDSNFACYKGKGVEKARNRLKKNLRESSLDEYVLKADLKSYFASIDHDILIKEFLPFIGYEDLPYYEKVVRSNGLDKGLSLGSEINQISASSFLYRFDRIASSLGKYERYMDDVLFIGTKDNCIKVLRLLESFVEEFKLTLSYKKTFIQSISKPISFLGFTFLKRASGRITMKRKKDKMKSEKRKVRKMKSNNVPIDRIIDHCKSVRSVMKKGNRSGLLKYDRFINNLFKEVPEFDNQKRKCTTRKNLEENIFPLVTCGRKNAKRNKN